MTPPFVFPRARALAPAPAAAPLALVFDFAKLEQQSPTGKTEFIGSVTTGGAA